MNIEQIRNGVRVGAERWSQMAGFRGDKFRLTEGAIELIVTVVDNISHDPSPAWRQHDSDSVQRYAISILPNIFADMNSSYRWRQGEVTTFSSWEILHNISAVLEKRCPIPKDI